MKMKTTRIEMLNMAMNMLEQAKIAQLSFEKIAEKSYLECKDCSEIIDSRWAKNIYIIIRGAVGIIEMSTNDIRIISEKDIYKCEITDKIEKDDDEDDDYE